MGAEKSTNVEPHLYELLWQVETDVCGLFYREYKVFNSEGEAGVWEKTRI